MISCASDPSNLPGFNSILGQSDAILLLLPLTHGEISNLALHSKMLLALLNPLLDCKTLHALKLTKGEASGYVSMLRKAAEDAYHVVDNFSLLTILKTLIWFTHEYHRQDKIPGKKPCSEHENELVSASQKLKSNIGLLVGEDVWSAVKVVLKLDGNEVFQALAARLLWCLAHDAAVKGKVLSDAEIIGTLRDFGKYSSPELKMATYSISWILGLEADGMYTLHLLE